MPFGAIAGAVGAVGSIAGGLISGGAANKAAQTQANAANQATALQEAIYGQTTQNLAPFLQSGTAGNQALLSYLGLAPGSVSGQPGAAYLQQIGDQYSANLNSDISQYINSLPTLNLPQVPTLPQLNLPQTPNLPTYNYPTEPGLSQFQQSPGYQYQLNQALNAAQNSAAGQTGSLSSNMLQAIQQGAAGLSAQDWNNYLQQWNTQNLNNYNAQYQNALTGYNTAYQNALTGYNAGVQNVTYPYQAGVNQALQQYGAQAQQAQNILGARTGQAQALYGAQGNYYNAAQQNWLNQLNALQNLSGSGQNAAAMQGGFGQNLGQQVGQNLQTAGAAQAAGTVGQANALNQGLYGLTTNLLNPNSGVSQNSLLGQILGGIGTNNPNNPGYGAYGTTNNAALNNAILSSPYYAGANYSGYAGSPGVGTGGLY